MAAALRTDGRIDKIHQNYRETAILNTSGSIATLKVNPGGQLVCLYADCQY